MLSAVQVGPCPVRPARVVIAGHALVTAGWLLIILTRNWTADVANIHYIV